MESAPPSYESATVVDYWDLIAHYLPSADLTSTALVCSRWHSTFAPHIWGNPASHLGIDNERAYVALTHFSRTLRTARLLVRKLTHTLLLVPLAQAEIYNEPHTDWLRDMLDRLPNLQSLIVRGISFFDHGALQSLAVMRKRDNRPHGIVERPAGGEDAYQNSSSTLPRLRLLDASRCSNVTLGGLASVLMRFEDLLYLDLSFTYAARSPTVLATLSKCTGLQVLKLRGVGLRDDGVATLCRSIGRRVRSLDIRENGLTDRSVRHLLDHCFECDPRANAPRVEFSSQTPPPSLSYLGSETLDIYQGEDFENYLRNAFTRRFVSRLAIEDTPVGGMSHLYIAGNALAFEGISSLIRSGRLHVLDLGSLTKEVTQGPHLSSYDIPSTVNVPDSLKLIPALAEHAAQSMTFLRVGYQLVTDKLSIPERIVAERTELDGTASSPRHAAELSSTSVRPTTYEMTGDPTTPGYGLSSDSRQHATSQRVDDGRDGDLAVEELRGTDAMRDQTIDGVIPICSSSCASTPEFSTSNHVSAPSDQMKPPTPRTRSRSYSSMVTERLARLAARRSAGHILHPSMLPHVTSLVLTDVPSFSANREVADRIISFIRNCAEEASLAYSEAKLDYALPPGRKGHSSAVKASANKLFALRRLVLEVVPTRENGKSSRLWKHTETKSMTEDRDSEMLWSAAKTDFSFFGDEDCGISTLEAGHSSDQSNKEVRYQRSPPVIAQAPSTQPTFDNIALISEFRKERKLAHQKDIAAGQLGIETEGFWDGIVQVVRHNNTIRQDEEVEYYGTFSRNNYLYR